MLLKLRKFKVLILMEFMALKQALCMLVYISNRSVPRNSPNVQYKNKHPLPYTPCCRFQPRKRKNAFQNPRFHLSCSATPTLTLSSFNWRSDRSMRVGAYSRSRLSHNALIRRSFVPLLCPSFVRPQTRENYIPPTNQVTATTGSRL